MLFKFARENNRDTDKRDTYNENNENQLKYDTRTKENSCVSKQMRKTETTISSKMSLNNFHVDAVRDIVFEVFN